MDEASEARFRAWAGGQIAQLHRTAYLLCGDWHLAEDLAQEALARAAVHWARIEKAEYPNAYVRQILVNLARQRRRRRMWHVGTGHGAEIAVDDGADKRASRAVLMAALQRLTTRQRATVALRYFEQLSEAETAQVLGCSVGTVKSQTHRALAKLRDVLSTEELPC